MIRVIIKSMRIHSINTFSTVAKTTDSRWLQIVDVEAATVAHGHWSVPV